MAIPGLVRSTPVEAVLADSRLPPISTRFQTISLSKADEWDHPSPAEDRRQALVTACRQRLRRNDWRITQFLCLNQLGLNHQVLTPNPPSCEQISIHQLDKSLRIPTEITPVDKKISPSQLRDSFPESRASNHPAHFQIITDGSIRDGIEDGGAGLVVLCQGDLVHEWHAPTAPIVAPSRQRRPPSKKPSNGYPPFHHGPQLSSSTTAITGSGGQQR